MYNLTQMKASLTLVAHEERNLHKGSYLQSEEHLASRGNSLNNSDKFGPLPPPTQFEGLNQGPVPSVPVPEAVYSAPPPGHLAHGFFPTEKLVDTLGKIPRELDESFESGYIAGSFHWCPSSREPR